METLGADLVLLSIRPGKGTIATKHTIGYGLRGSELVRLAASGRVGITGDRIVVQDSQPTGDERLDAALASLAGARRPPRAKTWVGHPGAGILEAYLARLAAAGVIRQERDTVAGFIPVVRWQITDTARAADARARLDAIARASGPVDTAQAAFAGLASASGLGPVLYPGWASRQLRQRLERIAKGELTQGAGAAQTAQATRAADAAARAAAQSATDAATRAATDAATAAATQAATHAAVSAAVHAAHHAASDSGAHGGHGGGGGGGGHH